MRAAILHAISTHAWFIKLLYDDIPCSVVQNAAEGQALSRRQQQYEEAVDDCDLREEEFYKAGGGAQRRK